MTLAFRLPAVRFVLTVFSLLLIPTLMIGTLAWMLPTPFHEEEAPAEDASSREDGCFDVLLDPGHGGMDGGAVSVTGELEKDLNLEMSRQLASILALCGLRTGMTRTDDRMLEADLPGKATSKMRDLAGRLRMMQEHPEALFVSIHMNRFSDPSCRGTQIWYAPGEPMAMELANAISQAVRQTLQPDNHRVSKAADEGIYLLHRAKSCAILVECGFLSNPEEAALLADAGYRSRLGASVVMGILSHLEAREPGAAAG